MWSEQRRLALMLIITRRSHALLGEVPAEDLDRLAIRLDGRRAEIGRPQVAAVRGGVGNEIADWSKMRGAGGKLANECDDRLLKGTIIC